MTTGLSRLFAPGVGGAFRLSALWLTKSARRGDPWTVMRTLLRKELLASARDDRAQRRLAIDDKQADLGRLRWRAYHAGHEADGPPAAAGHGRGGGDGNGRRRLRRVGHG